MDGICLVGPHFMQRIPLLFIVASCVLGSACDSSTSPTAPTLIATRTRLELRARPQGKHRRQSPLLGFSLQLPPPSVARASLIAFGSEYGLFSWSPNAARQTYKLPKSSTTQTTSTVKRSGS